MTLARARWFLAPRSSQQEYSVSRKWAPSDICCSVLLLMIALSHSAQIAPYHQQIEPRICQWSLFISWEQSVSSLQIVAGRVSAWLEKKANISMMWETLVSFCEHAVSTKMMRLMFLSLKGRIGLIYKF